FPISEIFTHSAPGDALPSNCENEDGCALTLAPGMRSHAPEVVLGTPTPRPMVIVAGGPAAVSVTSTSPAWTMVKGCDLLAPFSRVPVNVSFFSGSGVGAGVLLLLSHPPK